ncbi:MAG: hypothetical protein QM535_09515 [Limnohabitans sp.]|nr:hypothetical protein [Limnohabitans sp.]
MKKVLLICFASLLIYSCCDVSQNKNLIYQNIIILSDLSSRLDNRPQKDTDEIFKIIDRFKTECVKPGEKIGDKSCITFSVFSEKNAASIDIDKIKNLGEKQQFINSTGKYNKSGLEQKLKEFKEIVGNLYKTKRNRGLDLISLLIEKTENETIIKQDKCLNNGIDTTFIKFDNHIYIFTDGYLEYLNKKSNNQFYFGTKEIEKVRQFCIKNSVKVNKALEIDNKLGLPPYRSNQNKLITLHIMETHERDKNLIQQNYKHLVGQRDNEILEAVWRKWAKESGFKNLEWSKY